MNDVLDAAVRYARRGWPVFPCKPGSKEPATAHGFHDATTDVGSIERFWVRHLDMNVAIATGGDGPDILDVDVANGKPGYQSLHAAISVGLVPAPMCWVATASGGMHLYYCGDSQRNGTLPEQGLDFRAQGGYVVAPPSKVGERSYVVVSSWSDELVRLDFASLRERFAPRAEPVAGCALDRGPVTDRLARWVAEQKPGNRNQATFWAACRAAEASDSQALAAIADAAVSTGLERRAVDKTIASAVRTAAKGLLFEREAAP